MDKYQNGDVTNLTPETESWTDFLKKSFGWNQGGTAHRYRQWQKKFLRPNPGKNHLK